MHEQCMQSLKDIKGKDKDKHINKNRQVGDANRKSMHKASMVNFGQPKKVRACCDKNLSMTIDHQIRSSGQGYDIYNK